MTERKLQEVTQFQLASAVARNVDLESVSLVRTAAGLDQPLGGALELTGRGRGKLEIESTQQHAFDEKSSLLAAEVAFRVRVTGAGDDAKPIVHFEAVFSLMYRMRAIPPPEDRKRAFDAFVSLNGLYNAWPYLRELVQSTAGRMGLPPVVLPVFRPEMVAQQGAHTEQPR